MFKKRKNDSGATREIAMRIRTEDGERDVSVRELALSTNMSLEALLSVLIRKGVVSPDELIAEIETRKNGGTPDDGRQSPPRDGAI